MALIKKNQRLKKKYRKHYLKTGDVCITKDEHYMIYISPEDVEKMSHDTFTDGGFITMSHYRDLYAVWNHAGEWDDNLNMTEHSNNWDVVQVIKSEPGLVKNLVNAKYSSMDYVKDVLGHNF